MDGGEEERADAIAEEVARVYNKIKPPAAGEVIIHAFPCTCVPSFRGWDIRLWSKSHKGYDRKAVAEATRKVLDKRWVRK